MLLLARKILDTTSLVVVLQISLRSLLRQHGSTQYTFAPSIATLSAEASVRQK